MLHTQTITAQSTFPFTFESNWSSGRPKMDNNRDYHRRTSNGPYSLPPMADAAPPSTSQATPRTYATSPPIVQSSDENGLQLFQVFPDTYGYNPAYPPLPPPVQQSPYLAPPEVIYSPSQPSTSPHMHLPSPQYERYSGGKRSSKAPTHRNGLN